MSNESFWERTWRPDSLVGLVVSTVSTYILAGLFWWFGIATTSDTLTTLSLGQYAGGFVLGVLLSGGVLAIHAQPNLRERWRMSIRLRLSVLLPVGIMLGLLVSFVPATLSLGFVVLAVGFTLGRTYLYVSA